MSPGWVKGRTHIQEIELLPSSERDKQYIHPRLRQYNRQFMRDFKDYRFHIERDGNIIAGIVAASTMDTLETEFLFVEESHCGQGLGRPQTGLLNTYRFQAPCFGAYCQYYFIKNLRAKKREAFSRGELRKH